MSEGIYASLNGGIGSNDNAAHVSRKPPPHGGGGRRRAEHLVTCYQIHSPDVVVAEQSLEPRERGRAPTAS